MTFWGVPADPEPRPPAGAVRARGGQLPAGPAPAKPFMRLPSSCEDPLLTTMSFDTWARPPPGRARA